MMQFEHGFTIDDIDFEIRDLIIDINKLSFVKTKWSCAGYGLGNSSMTSGLDGLHPPESRGSAYLVLEFSESEHSQEFVNEICKLVKSFGGSYQAFKENQVSIYLTKIKLEDWKFISASRPRPTTEGLRMSWEYVNPVEEKLHLLPTEEDLKWKWNQIRVLVLTFQK